MKIKEILRYFQIDSQHEKEVNELSMDSRIIKQDDVFIAIGNGVRYISSIKHLASLILSDVKRDDSIYISDLKKKLTPFCFYFYGIRLDEMKWIGITGTTGKSSVAFFLHELLKDSFLVTTLKDIPYSYQSEKTTPDGPILIKAIQKAKKEKKNTMILEVSSIGIEEFRVHTIPFSYFIFLGIQEDHLDYHRTLENYKRAKLSFLKKLSCPIIWKNNPDYIGDKKYRYGLNRKNITKFDTYSKIQIDGHIFTFPYVEDFMIENFLGAYRCAKEVINDLQTTNISSIPGRVECVHHQPEIYIDYAHCTYQMETILKTFKKKDTRLIVLFGAGGNREKKKRKEYGDLVYRYADIGIVTNDNPRGEHQEEIVSEIIGGHHKFFQVIYDRKKAIQYALRIAKDKDIVLILGKGREDTQEVNGIRYPFSDYDEVRRFYE